MTFPRSLQGAKAATIVGVGILAVVALAIVIARPRILIGIAILTGGILWLKSMQRTRTLTRRKLVGAISVATIGALMSVNALAVQPDSESTDTHLLTAQSTAAPESQQSTDSAAGGQSSSVPQSGSEDDDDADEVVGEGVPLAAASVRALPATWKEHVDVRATRRLLDALAVKGRAPKTGYSREQFGQRWADIDRNGCDTRNDILARDLTDLRVKPGTRECVIVSGKLSDPYTGKEILFQKGRSSSKKVQIDHVVSLSDAWQKGAQQMAEKSRLAFANDPINLLAVDGPSNQNKGDGDAATWLPKNKAFRCTYVVLQIRVKVKYGLWVTQAEKDAMIRVLDTCAPTSPESAAPAHTDTPPAANEVPSEPAPAEDTSTQIHGLVSQQTPAPAFEDPAPVEPEPAPEPEPIYEEPAAEEPYFEYPNCCAVWQARGGPIWAGEPGFHSGLDRDGDGRGCERRPKNCH